MDLNGDGHRDLLLAGYSALLTVHYGAADGKLEDTQIIRSKEGKDFAQYYLRPCFWDWDDDGDLDMIASGTLQDKRDTRKMLHLFRNEGDAQSPVFPSVGTPVLADGKELEGSYQPVVHDWNGDGLEDLLLAGYSKWPSMEVLVAYNEGEKGAPRFGPQQLLFRHEVPEGDSFCEGKREIKICDTSDSGPEGRLSMAVGDLDGDGLSDLVLGDSCVGKLRVPRAMFEKNWDIISTLKRYREIVAKEAKSDSREGMGVQVYAPSLRRSRAFEKLFTAAKKVAVRSEPNGRLWFLKRKPPEAASR